MPSDAPAATTPVQPVSDQPSEPDPIATLRPSSGVQVTLHAR